jgi:glucose-1-phosphate thymidylyltransferase
MIYYPLTTLMLADIREILVISTPKDTPRFKELLGDGQQWGVDINYAVQESPDGLAQALIIGEEFLDGAPCALILGDNIFYGHSLHERLASADSREIGATIFAYHVQDPKRYGVVQFDKNGKVMSLEEKPKHPKSNYAATGLYFYDENASDYAKQIKPSLRNEYEITDLNKIYLEKGLLNTQLLSRGFAWLDTGTHETLVEAHQFVQTIEHRQGLKIACPEEIAFRRKWIDQQSLESLAQPLLKSSYGKYIMQVIRELENENN